MAVAVLPEARGLDETRLAVGDDVGVRDARATNVGRGCEVIVVG